MNAGDRETIIRLARVPDDRHPLPIMSGDPPEPIPARILAISRTRTSAGRPAYVLYFLDGAGRVLELLQEETMRAALDQAHRLVRVGADAWTVCKVEMREDGHLDPAALEALLTAL